MKKLVMMLLVMITSLLATSNLKLNASNITTIETVDVSIVKDSTTIIINHETNYNYNAAIFEYSYYENGKLYSKLLESKVKNDKFEIPDNSVSIKLHQLKYQKGNLIYRVSAKSNNTIGSFNNVTRIELTEVEFVKAKIRSISQGAHVGSGGSVFEFYFNFDKKHDDIKSIEVDYIIIKNVFLWIDKEEQVNKWVDKNEEIYYQFGDNLKALEKNTDTSIKADYVTRIEPHSNFSKAKLKNFAIIKIEYELDGEFFIDNTIHDPVSIYDDSYNDAIEWLLNFVDKIKSNVNSLISFFTSNASIIFKIIAFVAIVIIASLLVKALKTISFVFSLPLKLIKSLKSTLKYLFIPKKKVRRYK